MRLNEFMFMTVVSMSKMVCTMTNRAKDPRFESRQLKKTLSNKFTHLKLCVIYDWVATVIHLIQGFKDNFLFFYQSTRPTIFFFIKLTSGKECFNMFCVLSFWPSAIIKRTKTFLKFYFWRGLSFRKKEILEVRP